MKNLAASERLVQAVRSALQAGETRLIVALSGGPDSVALLASCVRLGSEFEVRAAHVHHGLRGDEADLDEAFVRALAGKLGVPLTSTRVDVAALRMTQRVSLETAAREARYTALERLLADWPGSVVLTGHTADDQAETVMMRLLRGAGPAGLSGIRARREHIVRPFLSLRRETILLALQELGQGYRLDSSNSDPRHTRNRIRRDLMPVLERLAPRAVEEIAQAAGLLAAEHDYLVHERDRVAASVRAGSPSQVAGYTFLWQRLHRALRGETLRLWLAEAAGLTPDGIDARLVAAAAQALMRVEAAGETDLGHGLVARRSGVLFQLCRAQQPPPPAPAFTATVPGEDSGALGSLRIDLPALDGPERDRAVTVCGPWVALGDADALGDRVIVRPRRPGDRLRPLGLGGSRKLQDILVDRKVPAAQRDRVAVIESAGEIVWVPGIALAERFALTPSTSRVARLCFVPEFGPFQRDIVIE